MKEAINEERKEGWEGWMDRGRKEGRKEGNKEATNGGSWK